MTMSSVLCYLVQNDIYKLYTAIQCHGIQYMLLFTNYYFSNNISKTKQRTYLLRILLKWFNKLMKLQETLLRNSS